MGKVLFYLTATAMIGWLVVPVAMALYQSVRDRLIDAHTHGETTSFALRRIAEDLFNVASKAVLICALLVAGVLILDALPSCSYRNQPEFEGWRH